MARWEPDSRGRLERATLALYGERGFEATTVAEIAERAGLTERTFFRHFADEQEVLFGGAAMLQELLVSGVAGAPDAARHPSRQSSRLWRPRAHSSRNAGPTPASAR